MAFTIVVGAVTYEINGLPVDPATSGKYARQFDAGDRQADINKFRVPGTNGSIILRNGYVGHKIAMTVRYVNASIDLLETDIATDINTFSAAAVTIAHNGQSYTGCNLIPGSAKKTGPVLATGRVSGQVFVDLVMLFSEDLPIIA